MIFLDSIWTKICKAFAYVTSCLIALLRLLFLTADFFISSVQYIIFAKVEITRVSMSCLPLRCERDSALEKVAYLDKLCYENPELARLTEEQELSETEEDKEDNENNNDEDE